MVRTLIRLLVPLMMVSCAAAQPTSAPAPEPSLLEQAAREHAARVEAQLAATEPPLEQAPNPADVPTVHWLDAGESTPTHIPPPPPPPPSPPPAPAPAVEATPTVTTVAPLPVVHDPSLFERAMQQAAAEDPDRPIDPLLLEQLTPAQREEVLAYRSKVIARLRPAMVEVPAEPRALRIANAQLCTRVTGYGVFQAFPSLRFLAGREQPMIVYAELTGYASTLNDQNEHEVRLTQEVILFNRADGLRVWHQPPQRIVDRSRSRRQDFYTVQLIRLPANLTVGSFTLKLRITDEASQTLDESNLMLDIVADESLTR